MNDREALDGVKRMASSWMERGPNTPSAAMNERYKLGEVLLGYISEQGAGQPDAEQRVVNAQDMAIKYLNRDMPERALVMATLAQSEATAMLAAHQKSVADWLYNWPLAFDGSPVISPNPN